MTGLESHPSSSARSLRLLRRRTEIVNEKQALALEIDMTPKASPEPAETGCCRNLFSAGTSHVSDSQPKRVRLSKHLSGQLQLQPLDARLGYDVIPCAKGSVFQSNTTTRVSRPTVLAFRSSATETGGSNLRVHSQQVLGDWQHASWHAPISLQPSRVAPQPFSPLPRIFELVSLHLPLSPVSSRFFLGFSASFLSRGYFSFLFDPFAPPPFSFSPFSTNPSTNSPAF